MQSKNNKIGIDLMLISPEEIAANRITGSIAVFTGEILDEIAKENRSGEFVLIINSAARSLVSSRFPDFELCEIGGWVTRVSHRLTGKLMEHTLIKYDVYNRTLKRKGITRVWFPYMVPRYVNHTRVDYVGTCHDLIGLIEHGYEAEEYARTFANAKGMATISNYVKQQVIAQFGIDGGCIDMIPNPIAMEDMCGGTKPIPELVNRKYLLDVNGYAPRKNTLTMIEAFGRIKDDTDCDLVLCGGYKADDYYDSCAALAERLQITDRVHMLLRVSEEEKNWLFRNCEMCITPSENEGFGRTPIEAAVCLKPVISTKATSLEEVTCGLLHYYDNPRDDKALAELILEVLANPDSPERLRMIRDTFVERYAPSNVVRQYLEMFERSFSK